MRSFRWLITTVVVVLGVAAIAIAIGAISLNSYIHSPGFKDEVASRASQSIGSPVQVDGIDFDVWHGIKLRGFVTQIDASRTGGQGALKVNVAQVNCSYSLWDLLAWKLRLTGIVLDQPQILLTKQPTEPLQTAPAPGDNTSAATPGSPATGAPASSGALFQFVLDRVKVNNGSLSVLDASGEPTVALQGVNASADTSGYTDGKDVTGSLRVAQVSASGLQVTNFSTPFTYHTNYLAAKPFDATAFNGRLAGDFLMDGTAGPSVLNLNGNSLDVAQLTAATSSGSSAHLTGSLDFQSKWRGAESGDQYGEGDAQLTNGQLQSVKIFEDVGNILHIDELKAPLISKATTHFTVQNRVVTFTGLQLTSTLFSMTGNGTVGFDSSLNANLVLILTQSAMGRLPKQLAASFVQQPDGTGSIGFQVSGTTSNPSTNLPEKLLMQNIQIKNVINKALKSFFH